MYLHGPDVQVHVVAVEVVGDVAAEPRPGAEGLQLELGLAHVGGEEVELAQLLDPHSEHKHTRGQGDDNFTMS